MPGGAVSHLFLDDWPAFKRCPNAARLWLRAYKLEYDLADSTRRDRIREVRRTAELALDWGMDIPDDLIAWYWDELAPRDSDVLRVSEECEFPWPPGEGRGSRRGIRGQGREDA